MWRRARIALPLGTCCRVGIRSVHMEAEATIGLTSGLTEQSLGVEFDAGILPHPDCLRLFSVDSEERS